MSDDVIVYLDAYVRQLLMNFINNFSSMIPKWDITHYDKKYNHTTFNDLGYLRLFSTLASIVTVFRSMYFKDTKRDVYDKFNALTLGIPIYNHFMPQRAGVSVISIRDFFGRNACPFDIVQKVMSYYLNNKLIALG